MIEALIGAGIALGLAAVAGCLVLRCITITATITVARRRPPTAGGAAPLACASGEAVHAS